MKTFRLSMISTDFSETLKQELKNSGGFYVVGNIYSKTECLAEVCFSLAPAVGLTN